MSFFWRLMAAGRAVQEGRSVAQAYAFVRSYFRHTVSQQSERETSAHLGRFAEAASVPELAVEYLNCYGRRLLSQIHECPDDIAEARSQFERFMLKVDMLERNGVRLSPVFVGPMKQITERFGDLTRTGSGVKRSA